MSDGEPYAGREFRRGHYPVNLCLTIPFFPRFIFITVIVGTEKRSRERLRAEREERPVDTWGNYIVVTIAIGVLLTAALFAVLVASAL